MLSASGHEVCFCSLPGGLVADQKLVDSPVFVIRVEFERTVDHRLDLRLLGYQLGTIFGKRYRCSPRHGGPIQKRHISCFGCSNRGSGVFAERRRKPGMFCVQPTQPVIAGTKIKVAGTLAQRLRFGQVLSLYFLRRLLNVSVGVLTEPARRSNEQAAMLGTLRKQTFNEFEAKGNGFADKLRIVIRGEGGSAIGQ